MLKVKDPAATIAEGFDWTSYLAALGSDVTIAGSSWTRTGPDSALTVSNASIVTGALKTQVLLAGGTLGATYTVTNRITTSSSPAVIDERSFDVLIENQ
jgi:hypothetical protein